MIRYRLSVPVVFSWMSAQGNRFRGEGSTRDISAVGAYILTPTSPPVDAAVKVEIMVSAVIGSTKARIKGRMRVQRVKHEVTKSGKSGFSVVGRWDELSAGLKEVSESGSGISREEKRKMNIAVSRQSTLRRFKGRLLASGALRASEIGETQLAVKPDLSESGNFGV